MNIHYLATLFLTGLLSSSLAHSTPISNMGESRTVDNVKWHKQTAVDIQELLNQSIPKNSANIIFLRKLDTDSLQTSANVAINDRFQVSLQPNHFSQVYSCVGVNQISADITGNKNNDLLKNHLTFKLEPDTTYFFDVDVDDNGVANVKHITKESALSALNGMKYQTHQITRVVPNCPPAPEPTVAPPVVIQPVEHAYESIELKVLFDNDKSIIKPQYYNEVQRVADFMTRHPEVTATIEGHTDSNASESYNVKLSQRRVDAVKQLLIQNYGIDASRLNAIGYGELRPVASNATAEGRQQNRRVVAVFAAT